MTNDAQRVVLIRHGETAWSKSGQHTGLTDMPLIEDGRHQAETLKPRLKSWTFAKVLSSPSQRARVTAELAGLPQVQVRDDLHEWNYGQYEGRTKHDILAENPHWVLWRDGAPGGEVGSQVAARVDRVIDEVRRVEGDVAVFSHGHLLRVFVARWLELPPSEGKRFSLDVASFSVLDIREEVRAVHVWNDVSHRG